MGVFRRFRDVGSLYFIFLGCAATSFYFLILSDYEPSKHPSNVEFDNLSRTNEYNEICRDWKKALDREKTATNSISTRSKPKKQVAPPASYDIIDDNIELTSYFHCDNSFKDTTVSQRGNYYAIYNFVKADKEFGCTESVTLSAPGDYRFLDNVIPLVDRWNGPISIALYAPGHDFYTTLKAIAYLRSCKPVKIKELVSFHIVFEQEHTPKQKPDRTTLLNSYVDDYDCSLPPPYQDVSDEDMYKYQQSLLYPINVVRNVAKLAAQTYFVFPSDIELYPTRNFITLFLQFVKDNLDLVEKGKRNVFVLPIFEIWDNQTVPESKTDLLQMLKKKTAIIFHQGVCTVCHRVIDSEKWIRTEQTEGLGVFSVGKRIGRYMVWEPFFVCTQQEPLWDERMTWEGQSNKMVQAYTMCVMDYDFYVLDNAFLIHKPGVKKKKVQMEKFKSVVRNSTKLIKRIAVELQNLYGYHPNCSIAYKSVMKKPPKSKTSVIDNKDKKKT